MRRQSIDKIEILIITIVFWLPLIAATQEVQQKLKVKAEIAFIRLQPDVKSQAVGRVSSGTVLDLLGKKEEWYRISLPLRKGGLLLSGYMHQSLVEEIEDEKKSRVSESRLISGAATGYTGEKITVRFKDADVRDAIMYLCDIGGLNVVFHPEVTGNVTCDLKDVPWDQALDLILKLNRLGKVLEGDILRTGEPKVLIREFK
jgi:type IV pilus assembly protein PilQ